MVVVFQKIIREIDEKPQILRTDQGTDLVTKYPGGILSRRHFFPEAFFSVRHFVQEAFFSRILYVLHSLGMFSEKRSQVKGYTDQRHFCSKCH